MSKYAADFWLMVAIVAILAVLGFVEVGVNAYCTIHGGCH